MSGLKNKLKTATLVDILQQRALNQPQKTAYTFLVDGETETVSLTYGELDRRARAIAAYLQSISLPQERVLLLFPSGLDYIEAFFGCLYAGVIAIPAYPPRPNRSLSRLYSIIQDADATIALTTHSIYTSLERQLAETPQLKQLKWVGIDGIRDNFAANWQEPNLSGQQI